MTQQKLIFFFLLILETSNSQSNDLSLFYFLKNQAKNIISTTIDLIQNETCKKIIQNNYLEKNSTQDEDENYSYLINYSSHSKNDISSYYPCTRKNSKYHYLIISFFPNETSSKNNSSPLHSGKL